ncbi:MAG TPA: selenide, water dikinase SelD [Myxococcota bacterium]|nr:selenide, water dikinase SelD [Myxococcota bacterium]
MERSRDALELVLVGGGHAHVQVLRRLAMAPMPGTRVTVVLDRPDAIYSGMVPGFAAGQYLAPELEIDVVPLARRAGAAVVLAAAARVDADAHRIELAGRPPLHYDIASLDVGASLRGLDLPGVREHAVATRPIRDFVDRLDTRLETRSRAGQTARVVVVGGGAAGVELTFCLDARLRGAGLRAELMLVEAAGELLAGQSTALRRRVRDESRRRCVSILCGREATRVEERALWLGSERLDADLVVWATGAAPHAWLADSPLPRDAQGFVRVRTTLQVEGHDRLFAVGDCASLVEAPWVTKAGVYAVREGPLLDRNLRARISGAPLRAHRPQRDFLALLNLGDGRALGAKWGLAASGRSLFRLKDHIDRRFVERFRVLDSDGVPAPDFARSPMEGEPMECGGCAAKLGATALGDALARLSPASPDDSVLLGLAERTDAAAWRTPRGDVVLASVDAFRAFADDPWLVGRVAAVNAVSDLYAQGGRPRHALALVCLPDAEASRGEERLFQLLAGVRAALDPLGVSLVGGHTMRGEELLVGLSITGELCEEPLPRERLAPGDRLILSKPLGTGVVLAANGRGLVSGRSLQVAIAAMLRDNAAASHVARAAGAHACTDVSGFGLLGHLVPLLRASGVSARLDADALPALPGARALLERGVRSTFHAQNERDGGGALARGGRRGDSAARALLFDPQTSGGLLFGVPADRGADAVAALRARGVADAACIGEICARRDGAACVELVEGAASDERGRDDPPSEPA